MASLRLILGDQLSHSLSALDGIAKGDVILMMEVVEEATYVRHHKQKIAFLFSAMRHFARELQEKGFNVEYVALGHPQASDLAQALTGCLTRHRPQTLVCVEPGEYRIESLLREVCAQSGVALELRIDRHFLCSRSEFAQWAGSRTQLRMEHFYRRMRREHNVLMQGDAPEGGAWNFDADNRARCHHARGDGAGATSLRAPPGHAGPL